MTVSRLAVQPAQSSKAMRTSTTTTTTTKDSVDSKGSLRLSSSSSPSPSNNSNKGKGSSTPFTSTTTATTTPESTTTATSEQQQQQQALPLFTPIWDYDRFPIGPCVRENRSSQEHDNPFLMLEYHQQNQRPQGNNARNASAVMIRSGSSSSASSTTSSPSTIQQQQQQQRNNRHQHHGSNASRSSSKHGSRNLHINILGKSSDFTGSSSLSSPPSPSLAADPSNFNISPDLLFFQPPYDADLDQQQDQQQEEPSNVPMTPAPAPTSKFDLYKAQMDRVRSSHRLHMHGHGRSASSSTASPTTVIGEGQLPFPSTPSSLVYSPPTPSSPTTIYTPSPSSSSAPPSFVTSSKSNNKKPSSQHGGGLFPKLFKKPSLSNNKSRVRNQPASPVAQPPTSPATAPATATSGTVGRNGSKSSLVNNNVERLPSPLSRRGSRSIATADPLCQALQRSPLEEQQDRWREEWLRPSGAMSSMFRDTPSKFNCPHCGAIKVVSNIQFVPGLMSYLVAFGLMFLTLGTLSYLPFRRDHEGTKDCIHWCPECEQRVARFNRANSTWEWI